MKLRFLSFVVLAVGVAVVHCQGDGRYRAPSTKRPASAAGRPVGDGRYRPAGDGRYRPAGDGRYRPAGDGRYQAGGDGRYVHMDSKYEHDARLDAGYRGDNVPYKQDKFRNAGDPKSAGGRSTGGQASGATKGAAAGKGSVTGVGAGTQRASGSAAGLFGGANVAHAVLQRGKGTGEGGNGWRILRLHDKLEQDGYHYLYETENGILAEEAGRIERLAGEAEGLRSKGFYEYTGDDGLLYRIDYVADDNGFVPAGEHIPKPLPYVAKMLEYLAANARNK